MKINLFKSLTPLLALAGLVGCKLPQTARYSPEWEIKTSVTDGDLPTPIALEEVTDVPLPSPEDKGSNLIETVDENGVAVAQTNGSSLGNSDIADVPLGGVAPGQNDGPGIERPGEPPMPHEGGPKFGVRIRETLLPTEEELKNAPAAMKVESSLTVTEAAPVLRTPGIAHTMHSVPTAPAAGRGPKPAPAPSPVSAASFASPAPSPAPAVTSSAPAPVLTPDQAAAEAPPFENAPAAAKAPDKHIKPQISAAKAAPKKEPAVAKKAAEPKPEGSKLAPAQPAVSTKPVVAAAEKPARAKKPAAAAPLKTVDASEEIATAPLPKAPTTPASKPAPVSTAAPATVPVPAAEKASQESAEAKSGSDLADILALAKKVEAKSRPAKSAE